MMALAAGTVISSTSAPTMGYFNRYNATAGGLTVTLPALSGLNIGARVAVQKYSLDISANLVVFNCAGSDKFDDASTTSFTLTNTGDQRELQVVSISGTKRWKFVGPMGGTAGSGGSSGPVAVYRIDNYAGADRTGATFSDTAVDAAITAMGTTPGILEFGAGTYKLNTTKTLAYPGQGIRGQGLGATTLDYRGTGDCLRVWDSTVATSGLTLPGSAGPITGITVRGWNNSNTNICGLHIGDLGNIYIQNVSIVGFQTSGSKCFWGENRYSWCERAFIQMETGWAPNNYLFETNASHPIGNSSWSYSTYDLALSADPSQNGVTLKKNIAMVGVNLNVWGNCFGHATTNTGAAITVGTTGTDTSFIQGDVTAIMESNGNPTVGHKDINIGAAARLTGVGALVFNDFSPAFVAGSASAATVSFGGRVDCPSLGRATYDDGLRAVGPAKLSSIKDAAAGNTALEFLSTGTRNNYFRIAVLGSIPQLAAFGTDADVTLGLTPRGAGGISSYVNTQSNLDYYVSGDGTDVGYNVIPQGAGRLKENGNTVGSWVSVPSTATSTGKAGQMAADSSWLYICTATNVWRRVAVASW